MKRGAKQKQKRPARYFDYNLLAVVIILICFGLVMLYSASAYEGASQFGDDMYYFKRQLFFSAAAVVFALFVALVDYHIILRFASWFYLIAMVLMAMVRYSPFGRSVNGARRWLELAGQRFLPSEITKIAVILFITSLILRMGKNINTRRAFWILAIAGGIPAFGAYFFTDNLSTGVIILGIALVMIFLARRKTWPYLVAFGAAIALVPLLLRMLGSYIQRSTSFRMRRILVWMDPEKYLNSGGYQVMQGLYAIGSGGLFGKGLGNSTQKLSTIPEAQNDMIFSIICEELGLFGAVLLLILFGYLLYRIFVIAQNAADLYGTLIAGGVFAHIALQVVLNICVVLNLIPTTGVTLPFVSYGGSSVIFLMSEIGLVLGVARRIPADDWDETTEEEEK